MVIAKPAPFLNFTPSLEWLENMRGVDAQSEEFVAKKTDFLMEIFKFMPKAAAYKFNKGTISETGVITRGILSGIRVSVGGERRLPTLNEASSQLSVMCNQKNGIKTIYNSTSGQITHAFAERIENGTVTEDDFNVTPVFSGSKREILARLKRQYYDGKNTYGDFRPYNEEYAYDFSSMRQWAPNLPANAAGNSYTNSDDMNSLTGMFPGLGDLKRTYTTSTQPYGFGLVHRQSNVGEGKGSQMYLSDIYKWFNGAADFKWSPDAVSGINNAVPVYDSQSQKFSGIGYKDFYPTDYTNMIYGLNPYTMISRTSDGYFNSYDLPEVTDYSGLFNWAQSYFSGNTKNYYDIIKTGEFTGYSTEQFLALFILMNESKRRFLYAMTEVFGPHTQGAGFAGYVGRDYYQSGVDSNGVPQLTANANRNDMTVDSYMQGRFSHFINDPRIQRVSGYKTAFLSIFYENSHEFLNFLAAYSSYKAVFGSWINDSAWFTISDRENLSTFFYNMLYGAMWTNMRNYIKDFNVTRLNDWGLSNETIQAHSQNALSCNFAAMNAVNNDVFMGQTATLRTYVSNYAHYYLNPAYYRMPSYNMYRLRDEFITMLNGIDTARNMQVRVEGGIENAEDLQAKKNYLNSIIFPLNKIYRTDNYYITARHLLNRLREGSNMDELRAEYTQTDTYAVGVSGANVPTATAYYHRLPIGFGTLNSWDKNQGNFISSTGHFYSPVEQKNNFGPGGPNKTESLHLNKYFDSYPHLWTTARPYEKVWGTKIIVDLSQAYVFEESMRFAVKHLWNLPRKRQYSARREEYYREKDREQEMEKATNRAEKTKIKRAKEALMRSERKKRIEKKRIQKKMMKEFTEKMKELRAIQRKNSAGTSQKPAKK